jgi:hypothetical protein
MINLACHSEGAKRLKNLFIKSSLKNGGEGIKSPLEKGGRGLFVFPVLKNWEGIHFLLIGMSL